MALIERKHGAVVEITLDWPEVRNAVGPGEGRELRLALERATADETVGAVVLSANGKAFCSGGKLPEIVELASGGPAAVESAIYGEFQGVFRAIRSSPTPVIAAVDGPAIGFGCDLALAGAVTLVGAQGWLAQGWMRAGLIPATGGTLYVAERGGPLAVWKLLAADRVDGPTAERWGLAIACERARDAALEMAAKFAAMPRGPLKALVELSRIGEPQAHLARALEHQTGFITDPGFAEAARVLLAR
jgi:enoyl-CoA hydratase/carnithine racemase